MEESVGKLWHRLITRAARRDYPAAIIQLSDLQWRLAPWLRALACDPSLGIEAASRRSIEIRRSLTQRIAGTGKVWPLAWRDGGVVRLPSELAVFPDPELNTDLYRWLAALASQMDTEFTISDKQDWVSYNRRAVNTLLQRYPGLKRLWQRLLDAYIPLRPSLETLTESEKQAEIYLREAISRPDVDLSQGMDMDRLAVLHPVLLWLSWSEMTDETPQPVEDAEDEEDVSKQGGTSKNKRHRKGEYAEDPDGRSGLMAFRLESMFSWTEYIPLDRTTDDADKKDAERASEDLDVITISRRRETQASKLRFDLDLPPAAHDDIHLGSGVPMPEWDYRKQRLVQDYCRVQPMITRQQGELPLPENLHIRAVTSSNSCCPSEPGSRPNLMARSWIWMPGCKGRQICGPVIFGAPTTGIKICGPNGGILPPCCWLTCLCPPMRMSMMTARLSMPFAKQFLFSTRPCLVLGIVLQYRGFPQNAAVM